VTTASFGHNGGRFDASLSSHARGEGDLRGEVTDGFFPSYGRAKLANVLETFEAARRWRAEGVPVVAHTLHPGAVLTNIWAVAPPGLRQWFYAVSAFVMRSADQGGAVMAWLCLARGNGDVARSGMYSAGFAADATRTASAAARDERLAARHWEVCEMHCDAFEAGGGGGGGGASGV